ncbi:MAG: helix-turn-helix domain-containing protein [Clostridium sp.]|nr:helix-turn-helix domain-containing protein [Clostridium sp.]MCM1443721.1 helix-turn-helix domain-containing protein [Candidatus Amulumruptor caecigallinarius]
MNYDNYIKILIVLLSDTNVSSNAELLYGLLVLLTYQQGYCYANNSYLAGRFNLGIRAITRLLKELSDNSYIKIEFKHKFIRKIYIVNEINASISLDFKD